MSAKEFAEQRLGIEAASKRFTETMDAYAATEVKRALTPVIKALAKYGRHTPDCDIFRPALPCTCGLAAALAAARAKLEAK